MPPLRYAAPISSPTDCSRSPRETMTIRPALSSLENSVACQQAARITGSVQAALLPDSEVCQATPSRTMSERHITRVPPPGGHQTSPALLSRASARSSSRLSSHIMLLVTRPWYPRSPATRLANSRFRRCRAVRAGLDSLLLVNQLASADRSSPRSHRDERTKLALSFVAKNSGANVLCITSRSEPKRYQRKAVFF